MLQTRKDGDEQTPHFLPHHFPFAACATLSSSTLRLAIIILMHCGHILLSMTVSRATRGQAVMPRPALWITAQGAAAVV